MSDIYDQVSTTYPLPEDAEGGESTPSSVGEKADAAKEQAGQMKDQVAESGAMVAGTAKDEAGKVVSEAKYQVKDLVGQAQGEFQEQAASQQRRVASGLRSVSNELGSMAGSSEGGGVAADLVQQAASRAGSIAGWLEERDPGSVLREISAYARRKPGTFIAVTAIAGLVAGRLTKSLVSNASEEKASTSSAAPAATATPAYVEPRVVPPAQPASFASSGTEGSSFASSDAEGSSFDDPSVPGEGTQPYSGDRA
jgi:uncharacterized protein YjbJ (UPF0337 family)